MTDTKLPEWPTKPIDDRLSVWQPYWEQSVEAWSARCRLLYAAIKSVEAVFDGEDYEVLGFLNIAETALRDCGPLPEEQP